MKRFILPSPPTRQSRCAKSETSLQGSRSFSISKSLVVMTPICQSMLTMLANCQAEQDTTAAPVNPCKGQGRDRQRCHGDVHRNPCCGGTWMRSEAIHHVPHWHHLHQDRQGQNHPACSFSRHALARTRRWLATRRLAATRLSSTDLALIQLEASTKLQPSLWSRLIAEAQKAISFKLSC